MKPKERELAHFMCLDSFDRHLLSARLRVDYWTRRLGFIEEKGPRPGKTDALLVRLKGWLMVDINPATGLYTLRPYFPDWNVAARAKREGTDRNIEEELKLYAERPFSESFSELSREKALLGLPSTFGRQPFSIPTASGRQVESGEGVKIVAAPASGAEQGSPVGAPGLQVAAPDWPRLWKAMAEAAGAGDLERLAELEKEVKGFRFGGPGVVEAAANGEPKVGLPSSRSVPAEKYAGGSAEISAECGKAARAAGQNVSAEISAGIASLALITDKAELAKAADKNAALVAKRKGAWEWLESIDVWIDDRGTVRPAHQLNVERLRNQWLGLVSECADYVVRSLKGRVEERRRQQHVQSPLALAARIARDEGRLR